MPDLPGVEEAFLTQSGFAQEFLGPVAQRTTHPFGNWRRKAFFGAVHQGGRDILMENLPQQPFALVSLLFEGSGKAARKFIDSMVEERNPCLQADRHGGPVNLHQYVVRQIRNEVEAYHPLQWIGQVLPV